MERCWGPRAPLVDTPTSQGKGMEAAPTLGGVEWPKAVVVVVQRRGPGGDGTGHHDDRGGGGMGRQPSEAVSQSS
jgi:hypothetical protein